MCKIQSKTGLNPVSTKPRTSFLNSEVSGFSHVYKINSITFFQWVVVKVYEMINGKAQWNTVHG